MPEKLKTIIYYSYVVLKLMLQLSAFIYGYFLYNYFWVNVNPFDSPGRSFLAFFILWFVSSYILFMIVFFLSNKIYDRSSFLQECRYFIDEKNGDI